MKSPRRTIDWLRMTRRASVLTIAIVAGGMAFTITSAQTSAADGTLDLKTMVILLAIAGQTTAIAFFAGGLAARVIAIEKWRDEHIKWADRQVERLEKADETLRSRPPGAHN